MSHPESSTSKPKRRRRFIDKRIQLKFVTAFACTAGLAVLVQSIVMGYVLASIAEQAPNDQLYLAQAVPRAVATSVVASFVLLLPATIMLGILTTFPVVGPLYRIRQHLASIIAGERPGPCRVRSTDELQDMCELINGVVATLEADETSREQRAA